MDDREKIPRRFLVQLRLLRKRLHYQLTLMKSGHVDEAALFASRIDDSLAQLQSDPLQSAPPENIRKIYRDCMILEEELDFLLNREKEAIARELFQLRADREIKRLMDE